MHFFLIKPTDAPISQIYFCQENLHVSGSSSAHHQEFSTVHSALVYVIKPAWHMPVPNIQWKTSDDGQRNCPKHVEFLDKNKSGKLVHLHSRPQFHLPPLGSLASWRTWRDLVAKVGTSKRGGKQWQTTPKNFPRMQRTRSIPVVWLSSDLCPNRPKGWIPIIIIIIVSFMQGSHTHIPGTNHVPRGYTVAAILSCCLWCLYV